MIEHPQYVVAAFVLLLVLSFCARIEERSCDAARGLEYDRDLAQKICETK